MEEDFKALTGDNNVSVHAGFPNAASGHHMPALALDLNQLLVKRPSSTYLFRIAGHNWSDQGIHDGDVAIVDRSAIEKPGDLIVIWQGNDFHLIRRSQLTDDQAGWGVISAVIHKF